MVDSVPLYIVDIRNEWKHLPSFDSAQKFTYFLMGNRDRRFVRYPSNNKYFKEGQFRFNFSSKNELLTLFTYMRHFRNCTIIVDEADALFSDNKFKDKLTDVFLGSRNNNVTMVFVAKRPFLIPILVRSQAERYIIFRTEEKRDIDYLETRLSNAFPKNPKDLKQGEAILVEQDTAPQVVQFEKFTGE